MNLKPFFSILLAFAGFGFASAHAQAILAGQNITITIQGVPGDEAARVNSATGYPVDQSGYIRMPYIGGVRAAGLTPNQLASSIEGAYRNAQIYTNPTIQVIATAVGAKINMQTVFVGGQVNKTGGVEFTQGLTLYQAVQSAGGPTAFGALNRVEVLRGGENRVYNLKDIKTQQIAAQPGDTIKVPEKNWLGN